MDPHVVAVPQGFPGTIDILVTTAGQAADGRAPHSIGDLAYRFKIAHGSDRKSGLDDVHAQIDQRLRNFELLAQIHAAARRLLAVAQGRVEDCNLAVFARCGHGIGPWLVTGC